MELKLLPWATPEWQQRRRRTKTMRVLRSQLPLDLTLYAKVLFLTGLT